jgi:putative transposase
MPISTGLKKNLVLSHKQKLLLIDKANSDITISHQAELLGISRSSIYYEPVLDEHDFLLKRLIDEQYTKTPYFGARKMAAVLRRNGYQVNRKHVQRLMREMGIEAIYPKSDLSKPHPGHKIYPYLLRNVTIDHKDQVWASDLTYIPLARGFMYLVAIMDWWSRYVLAWQMSTSMDVSFCLSALEIAFGVGNPEIFNSDQGSQFTSDAFTDKLKDNGISISMDGRGHCMDNIFTERLWRTVKYENVYLMHYETVPEAMKGIDSYFHLYNNERPHQSLGYKTPAEVYF